MSAYELSFWLPFTFFAFLALVAGRWRWRWLASVMAAGALTYTWPSGIRTGEGSVFDQPLMLAGFTLACLALITSGSHLAFIQTSPREKRVSESNPPE